MRLARAADIGGNAEPQRGAKSRAIAVRVRCPSVSPRSERVRNRLPDLRSVLQHGTVSSRSVVLSACRRECAKVYPSHRPCELENSWSSRARNRKTAVNRAFTRAARVGSTRGRAVGAVENRTRGTVDPMNVKTLTKGEQTRERILDLAQDAVLHKGFAATSIDELIAAAGITKSGFFYHFRDKNDLAKALLKRYLERDDAIFDESVRARRCAERGPAARVPGLPEDAGGSDGRSADRASRLHRRVLLPIRTSSSARCARAERGRRALLARALSQAPRPHRRALSAQAGGQSRCDGRHAVSGRRWRDHPEQDAGRSPSTCRSRSCSIAPSCVWCFSGPETDRLTARARTGASCITMVGCCLRLPNVSGCGPGVKIRRQIHCRYRSCRHAATPGILHPVLV